MIARLARRTAPRRQVPQEDTNSLRINSLIARAASSGRACKRKCGASISTIFACHEIQANSSPADLQEQGHGHGRYRRLHRLVRQSNAAPQPRGRGQSRRIRSCGATEPKQCPLNPGNSISEPSGRHYPGCYNNGPVDCSHPCLAADLRDRRRWGCVTTWAVAPPADSRAHLYGVSSRASWCRQPQTIAETRVPTVRRPSQGRRVAQAGLSRRIGAGQTTGDAILSQDR